MFQQEEEKWNVNKLEISFFFFIKQLNVSILKRKIDRLYKRLKKFNFILIKKHKSHSSSSSYSFFIL